MKELVEKIATLVAEFNKDANAQIENGNKAAGTRARKASLEIEKAMKEFRIFGRIKEVILRIEKMEKSVSILKPAFLFYRILIRLYFRNDNLVDILFLCTLGFRQ